MPVPKRAVCAVCLRAQAACICHWVRPVASSAELLILQHPMEVSNAKGSARLLHLCLANSSMLVGEQFPEEALRAAVHGGGRAAVLLYPDTPEHASLGLPPAPALDPGWLRHPAELRVVVLDGTWRKSRKMLYLNPLLQGLPRLALSDLPASQYAIRKAHAPDQMSTLEASCYALMRVEGQAEKFQPLLHAFDGFVAQQAAYRPALSNPRA